MALKNILAVSTSFERGGAGRLALTIGQGIDRSKFGLTYYSASDYPLSIKSRMGTATLVSNDQIWGRDITKLDSYKRADIVHLHNLHGGYFRLDTLAKITAEKKVVWTLHDLWAVHGKSPGVADDFARFAYPPMLFDRRKSLLARKKSIYQECVNLHLVVPSLWMQEQVKNSILKDFPIQVISNGITTDKYILGDKEKLKQHLELKGKVVLIVASGGVYNESKGGRQMLELADLLPTATFVIVGGKNGVVKKNIRYLPTLARDELIPYYQAADVFVSLSHAESFGLAIAEASSCGTPVVAYDVGAVKEVIFSQDYLVKDGDVKAMAKKVSELLTKSNKEIKVLGKKARKHIVDNFNLNKMVEAYQKLYTSIL